MISEEGQVFVESYSGIYYRASSLFYPSVVATLSSRTQYTRHKRYSRHLIRVNYRIKRVNYCISINNSWIPRVAAGQ